jgi:hypothetical protein
MKSEPGRKKESRKSKPPKKPKKDRQPRPAKTQKTPFHNPFAEALGGKSPKGR